ncbi:MAG: hypothetical protein U0Q15_20655 [Kineosporiaceae bacterium]
MGWRPVTARARRAAARRRRESTVTDWLYVPEGRLPRRPVWPSRRGVFNRIRARVVAASGFPLVQGVVAGALVWVFLVGLSSIDHFAYRGIPVEDAAVVSVAVSDTVEVACGKGVVDVPAEIVTYRSLTPRQGLPVQFWRAACPGPDEKAGDVIRVVRTGTEPDQVYPYPIETSGQLATWPLVPSLIVAAAVGLILLALRGWPRRERPPREGRGSFGTGRR